MILYGEYVSQQETAPVRILGLGGEGCDIEADNGSPSFDNDFSLWIGAVGPFAATLSHKTQAGAAVRFKEPLDGRILHHFSA
ncbi:hypothetical protein WSK_3185 [Novosphingobium sp. Rr 2-17]|uniref:hypothetical protein n=1 Tax=Novosphingobium sp. Rr 2-17 TaxID=555793 RepID=UPI000269856E|nr:hypothetical protein [Novosphingobium sp. Rr 2-17]EIZ78210.1 hypothetical protein WSK_3185 [Novosphingobium sp. Rr 2-17]